MISLAAPFPSLSTKIFLPDPDSLDRKALGKKIANAYTTVSGLDVTYIRSSEKKKLGYDFELSVIKAEELKRFILVFSVDTWLLEDYVGSLWLVTLLEQPAWSNSSREDYQKATLSLQGTPYA